MSCNAHNLSWGRRVIGLDSARAATCSRQTVGSSALNSSAAETAVAIHLSLQKGLPVVNMLWHQLSQMASPCGSCRRFFENCNELRRCSVRTREGQQGLSRPCTFNAGLRNCFQHTTPWHLTSLRRTPASSTQRSSAFFNSLKATHICSNSNSIQHTQSRQVPDKAVRAVAGGCEDS